MSDEPEIEEVVDTEVPGDDVDDAGFDALAGVYAEQEDDDG